MRILEILDTKQQFFKTKKPFAVDIISREQNKKALDSDGLSKDKRMQGAYGSVRLHKRDPHLVRKRSIKPRGNLMSDGYYAFISDLIEFYKRHGPNPYLPRIYNIHHVEDSEGEKIYTADIERLFELDTLTKKDIESIFYRMFGQEYEDKGADDDFEMASMMEAVITALRNAVELNEYTFGKLQISDEQLIKALRFIRNVAEEGYWIDVRLPNIMVRRTPHGPQLVLTDPIGD